MTTWQEWPDWHGYERCLECKRQETLNEYQLCEPCFKALGPWLEDVELDQLTVCHGDPLRGAQPPLAGPSLLRVSGKAGIAIAKRKVA